MYLKSYNNLPLQIPNTTPFHLFDFRMSISEVTHENVPRFVASDCVVVDHDAEDDALSLCDMPLYGDAAYYYSFSSEERDEFFEFSSSSSLRDRPDKIDSPGPSMVWNSSEIVFCGKLIRSVPLPSSPYVGGRTDRTVKRNRNRKGVEKKARVIAYSSPRSDKWYMMAFGMARFPREMALSEIRRRQGKGNHGGGRRSDSGEMVVSGKKGESGWGMMMMMKALGCSRRRDGEAAVKASSGCIPRL